MKSLNLFLAAILVAGFTVGCSDDKGGMVIDIVHSPGTDEAFLLGATDGNYKVTLSIPQQQGDYVNLNYAQLYCVFTDSKGNETAKFIGGKIKEFPAEVALDFDELYEEFGVDAPAIGQTWDITANGVLLDGTVVYGWSKATGFTNKNINWQVDGRPYSYSASYPVVAGCELDLENFVGIMSLDDPFFQESVYDVTCLKVSDKELAIKGFFREDVTLKISINPKTYAVTIPKQVLCEKALDCTNVYVVGAGTIEPCDGVIKFRAKCGADQGNWGEYDFELTWIEPLVL